MPTVIWIASALAAGVLARVVMKSRGFGFVGDAVLGVLGSVSGAWLLRFVGGEVSPGGVAHIATAVVGAICLVAVGRLALRVAQGASQLSEATVGATLPDIETQIRRLSDLEKKVLTRVLRKQGLPRDPSETFRQHLSLGDRVADRVAIFGGSWTFLGCFAAFMSIHWSGFRVICPFTLTRPACVQLRASTREPTPALDSTRSSVLRGRFFSTALHLLHQVRTHPRVPPARSVTAAVECQALSKVIRTMRSCVARHAYCSTTCRASRLCRKWIRGGGRTMSPSTEGILMATDMTIPRSDGAIRTNPLPQFVTVRAATYMFLPSVTALRFLGDGH